MSSSSIILRYRTPADKVQESAVAKAIAKPHLSISAGYILPDRETVQVAIDGMEDSSEKDEIITALRSQLGWGVPIRVLQVQLPEGQRPAVSNNGPLTSNVTELVESTFPASRVTPELPQQITADFERFEKLYQEGKPGDLSLTYGWSDVNAQGERSFVVIRGWRNMEDFEKALQTEAFHKSKHILFGWNAPHEMWHVERANGGT